MTSELCANSTRFRIAAIVLLVAWVLTLASPVALHAGNKKKNATADKPAAAKPQQDLSKLVWPAPPNIPRVRYTSYFAGMQFDKETDAAGKKTKQTWMDRLAGTQSQDEKFTAKNFPLPAARPLWHGSRFQRPALRGRSESRRDLHLQHRDQGNGDDPQRF